MPVRLNITMDKDLYHRLKEELPAKGISSFINDAVRARLFPDARALDLAYQTARREKWRQHFSADWETGDVADWPGE